MTFTHSRPRMLRVLMSAAVLVLCTTGTSPAAGLKEVNPPAEPEADSVIALVGGRVIDGRGGPPLDDAAVLIRGAKIAEVGPAGSVTIPDGAVRIDTGGMSVLPGLIDSHFHSINDRRLPVEFQLQHGVTSFRDPGHPFRFYQAVMQADEPMPRVFLCGAHLDAYPPVWPQQAVIIQDAGHARRTVNAHVDRGASAIKIYFRLPLEHFEAVCETARQRGVPVTAHLELVDADDAIRAGVRGIEHVTSFGTALAEADDAAQFKAVVGPDANARHELRYRLWANLDLEASPRVQPLLELIVRRKVFVSPTLALFERRAGERDATALHAEGFANMKRFVSLCHRAGAKVVVGSHTWVPYADRGRACQRELELLVEAGLTPLEAITAATQHNAEFFGAEDRLGTLQPGRLADLIVVEGNPAADIRALADVRRVMLNGIWVHTAP